MLPTFDPERWRVCSGEAGEAARFQLTCFGLVWESGGKVGFYLSQQAPSHNISVTPLRKTLDFDPHVVLTAATLIFLVLHNLEFTVCQCPCVCVCVCRKDASYRVGATPPFPLRWLLFVSQYDNMVAVQTLSIKYLSLTKPTFTSNI